jgi:hypothetical protein
MSFGSSGVLPTILNVPQRKGGPGDRSCGFLPQVPLPSCDEKQGATLH